MGDVTITERTIATNGVDLRVFEAGPADGFPVVLCHGFPELAYSWRHQLPALAEAGYHVLAPDQRGYGGSTRPDTVEAYEVRELCADICGLLDAVGAERAVVVGHDWGSIVAWSLAQRFPERFAGVVGMSVPFVPRAPMPPTQLLKMVMGDTFFYMLYFQDPVAADADLSADVRHTMRGFMAGLSPGADADMSAMLGPHDGRGLRERLPDPETLPDWLTEDELATYIANFEASGFFGPTAWYANLDRNWEHSEDLAETKVTIPAMFLTGSADPVVMMTPASVMDGWVTDLRASHSIEGAGHWVQQERPDEVNAALVAFLDSLDLS